MRHRESASTKESQAQDLFRLRLDQMLDRSHGLVRLSDRMPWDALIADLGCEVSVSGAGRYGLPVRLMAGLLYLKHAYNLSDEQVCARWVENPYWQYFCGEVFFQTKLPCDPSSLVRWRKRLDKTGIESLLSQTIECALAMKAVRKADLSCVVLDTTVQEKAIAYPVDSRLLEVARKKLVQLAERSGIDLRQNYNREGPRLRRRAGGYAHAKQGHRLQRTLRRQRTILGRVIRDLERKIVEPNAAHQLWLERAKRIQGQQRHDKNKLYALHAPEVECLSKGKSRHPYEFGVKVGFAISAKRGLILGAQCFPGNPYDGDTLAAQLRQVEQLSEQKPSKVIVDLGYRGRCIEKVDIIHRGKFKSMTRTQKQWLKRRQSIEPIIGHLKQDCRLGRNPLKGAQGDSIHPLLCAAGFNLRWLLAFIALYWALKTAVLALLYKAKHKFIQHRKQTDLLDSFGLPKITPFLNYSGATR